MRTLIVSFFTVICLGANAQNISSRSNEVALDFGTGKSKDGTVPTVAWLSPENEITFLKEGKVTVNLEVTCKQPLKSVTLTVRDKESGATKGTLPVQINGLKDLSTKLERDITLADGISVLEIVAESESGYKSLSKREVHVGTTLMADAAKLNRKDYALIIATDKYDNWTSLVNPVFDARTIENQLKINYGFQTDVVENPTKEELFVKLREYAERKYNPLDQLFIFIAGHGFYDDTFKEGFVVPRESLQNDPGRTSYIRHSELRSAINNNPCEHVFLVMDVCFGGTFDENTASRNLDEAYGEPTQSELIARKLQFRTRKYLTSGGKEYVSDGVKGSHSPFAKQLIAALNSMGGNDGILTLSEMLTYVEKLKTAPQFGKFGNDKQGSEFVFVVK